jgi:hypothetical protein
VRLAPARAADEIGRLGHYRVLGVLGQGGMGAVFRAEDTKLKRQVALKVMLPDYAANETARRRFLREAEAQAAVEHDHIVSIYQVGEEAGVPFIAMPLLKGMTLQSALGVNPRPPLAEVLRIGREIAQGLAAAHERGLMHRDIKPGNVWLEGKKLRVKILDFGLARAEVEVSDDGPLTTAGAIVGTPTYMSPEQARGTTVDHRTDLWSLGVLLYQMTTGRLPFVGSNTMAVLTALAVDDPVSPRVANPDLPPDLDRLIMTLLDKNPDRRPGTAESVADELARIEQTLTQTLVAMPLVEPAANDPWAEIDVTEPGTMVRTALPQRTMAREPTTTGGRWWWAAALGLLVLLGGVGFALYKFAFDQPEGSLVVTIEDPEVEARFQHAELRIHDQDGQLLHTFGPGDRKKDLPAGRYLLRVAGADGLKVDVPEFTLIAGTQHTVRLTLVRPVVEKKDDEKVPPLEKPRSFALEFDGKSSFVGIPSLILDGSHPLTLEALVSARESANPGFVICNFHNKKGFGLGASPVDGFWRFQAQGTAGLETAFSPKPRQLKERTHLAAVCNGKRIRLFVNGAAGGGRELPEASASELGFAIGANPIPTPAATELDAEGDFFHGIIDEVRISKVARYDEDYTPPKRLENDKATLALYRFDEGRGDVLRDASGNGHHGKIAGARWTRVDGDLNAGQ